MIPRRPIPPLAAAILPLLALAAASQARAADILDRLISEPITLLDWGLAQLDRDIAFAADQLIPYRADTPPPATGSIYDWRSRKITVYVAITLPPAERTRDACAQTFRALVDLLTEHGPSGPNAAGSYLRGAFQPKAHFWGDRFEDVGGKLLDLVRLEVSYLPDPRAALRGDSRRVRCTGRLDARPDEMAYEETS